MKRSREPEEAPAPPEQAAPSTTRDPSRADGDGALMAANGGGQDNDDYDDDDGSPPAAKITELDLSDNSSEVAIHCSLPPHRAPVVFSSYRAYESHYRDQHTNRCAECRKNFPSAHLLGIHIEEMHDSFVQARKERGDRTVSSDPTPRNVPQVPNHRRQYSCFVEGCDRKCSTPQKRKMHLIDKHMYPKNFFFGITRDGIDGRRSLLQESRGGGRRRRGSGASAASRPRSSQGQGSEPVAPARPTPPTAAQPSTNSGGESPEQQPDQEMEDLSGAMSALQFVPMSVRFGRGKKAGFAKR